MAAPYGRPVMATQRNPVMAFQGNSPVSGGSAYQDLYRRIFGQMGPGGFQWTQQATSGKLGQYADQFTSTFRTLTGRDPTSDELNSFFQNIGGQVAESPAGFSGTSYSDLQNLLDPYIQNKYSQDVLKKQHELVQKDIFQPTQQLIGQQQQQFGGNLRFLQDLMEKQRKATTDYYTTGQGAEALKGSFNNLGLLNSGAFSEGLANTLASEQARSDEDILRHFAMPSLMGQQDTLANFQRYIPLPYQNMMAQQTPAPQGLAAYGQRQASIDDFNRQADLMRQLQKLYGGGGSPFGPSMLSGALGGAATGAQFGPWGALIGAGAGAGLGAGFSRF